MKNNFYKFILSGLLFASVIVGCNEKKGTEYVKLLMRSPYGCTHIVTLDKSGSGEIISGEEENYDEDFTNFSGIIKEGSLKITDNDDISNFNKIIDGLSEKELSKTSRPHDAFHYEVYIHDKKKIDAYARKSEVFNKLKDIISKYYPYEVDYNCEAYVKNQSNRR